MLEDTLHVGEPKRLILNIYTVATYCITGSVLYIIQKLISYYLFRGNCVMNNIIISMIDCTTQAHTRGYRRGTKYGIPPTLTSSEGLRPVMRFWKRPITQSIIAHFVSKCTNFEHVQTVCKTNMRRCFLRLHENTSNFCLIGRLYSDRAVIWSK